MGRLAIGINALGNSSGFDVNVFNDTPGPHRIIAWNPVGGTGTECGMATQSLAFLLPYTVSVSGIAGAEGCCGSVVWSILSRPQAAITHGRISHYILSATTVSYTKPAVLISSQVSFLLLTQRRLLSLCLFRTVTCRYHR